MRLDIGRVKASKKSTTHQAIEVFFVSGTSAPSKHLARLTGRRPAGFEPFFTQDFAGMNWHRIRFLIVLMSRPLPISPAFEKRYVGRELEAPSGIRLPLGNPEQRRLIGLKLRRTDSNKPAKHSREVTWIRKSGDSARVQHGAPRITQRSLCPFDSLLQHITVGCATHASLEQLRKMVRAHARQFGERRQADVFG